MKTGIDISYHQGNMDFDQVKNDQIDFVILREGYRNSTDKKFFEYVSGAKAAGIPILGVYHFAYALNEEQAVEEARLCVENIKKAGLDKNTLVFYDFEYDTVKKAAKEGITLGPNECVKHTVAFCEEVKQLGYTAGFYCNKDYYKNWYNPGEISNPHSVFSTYKVWLADYKDGPDYPCLIQQYSSKGVVFGISTLVDMNYYFGDDFKMEERSRSKVVSLAESWLGKNEADGSYKSIIDIYNSFPGPFPRGVKMQYGWSWCACTWSALAIALGYTDIMPIEISCGELIKQADKMGCWQENDAYIPSPGDAILYDWQDNGQGDNTSWPDHVGVIEYVNQSEGYMIVIEGNYKDSVKKRTVSINGKFIRGFITPAYTDNQIDYEGLGNSKDIETLAREVIAGLWGSGSARKEALERRGYNYAEIQAKVNEILKPSKVPESTKKVKTTCSAKEKDYSLAGTYVTTADLNCRNDAGSNKKSLCVIPKGTVVQNYGFFNTYKGTKWLLIQFTLNNIVYTGFSSSKYLKKQS